VAQEPHHQLLAHLSPTQAVEVEVVIQDLPRQGLLVLEALGAVLQVVLMQPQVLELTILEVGVVAVVITDRSLMAAQAVLV
jgi:hypothetical protein